MGKAPGLFDFDNRLKRLSDLGDQLEAFGEAVDFEMFRADLVAALDYSDGERGGRPPFDPVMMFKILVIQAANNLSDERAEFLINDRLSFMRFLGLDLTDRVPDARTIWLFREKLTRAEAIKGMFSRFDAALRAGGYIAMSGQIVDASLVSAPKQRNTTEERQAIKEGRVPEDWKGKPAKLRHKDRDARWTVKFTKAKERADGSRPPVDIAIPTFGYQNHIGIAARPDPHLAGDKCRHLRGGGVAQRASQHNKHGTDGVGGHRLPFSGERGLHGRARFRQPRPPQEAQGSADAGAHAHRQRAEVGSSQPG